MFELSALSGILHVSAWTGIFIGALAVLALVVYLDPAMLRPAIGAAAFAAVCYGCVIYGDYTGRADVQKEWDAAKIESAKAAAARDEAIGKSLAQQYEPVIAALKKQAADSDQKVADYEHNLLPKLAQAGSCDIGADALRLRHR